MPSLLMEADRSKAVVDAVRKRHAAIVGDGPVGIVGSFCKDLVVDTSGSNRDIVGVATTDDIDLEDEVVLAGGIDWSYCLGNRKLFVDHDYVLDKCVGALRSLTPMREGGVIRGWKFRAHIFKSKTTPYPDMVLEVAEQGGIALSIGFKPMDWGRLTAQEQDEYPSAQSIVRRCKGLEITFTGMPMNVPCQGQIAPSEKPLRQMALKSQAVVVRRVLDSRKAAPEAYTAFGLEPLKPRKLVVWTGDVPTVN